MFEDSSNLGQQNFKGLVLSVESSKTQISSRGNALDFTV